MSTVAERLRGLPRVGLGCMRLSTAADRDEARGREVLAAAVAAGVRVFDTAHAYGLDEADLGHNERLLGSALPAGAFIVSKVGMARPKGRWVPDGRAATVLAQAEASAAALGRPADVLLLHVPDPRTAWSTSLRALAQVKERGLARAVGLSNVNLAQLDAAFEWAPIEAVQLAWSPFDDTGLRSGVIARCFERGLAVLAHTPLGGARRAPKLRRNDALLREAMLAAAAGDVDGANVGDAEVGGAAQAAGVAVGLDGVAVALHALISVHPSVVAFPGATRVPTAVALGAAQRLHLDAAALARIAQAWPALRRPEPIAAAPATAAGEVVLVMGLQGAGKSQRVQDWEAKGYARLNRDLTGSTLDALAAQVEARAAAGERRFVLDNTYTTRASRSRILAAAAKHGLATHGVWLEVPLHEAQVNVVWRMLEAHGRLLSPQELAAQKDNTGLPPLAQLRMLRALESPTRAEGFTTLETQPFARLPRPGAVHAGTFVAASVAGRAPPPVGPTLLFDWRPGAAPEERDALAKAHPHATVAWCTHPAGPPACWCRPPLPGLLLAFAHAQQLELSRCTLYGNSDTHQVMAGVVGARYLAV